MYLRMWMIEPASVSKTVPCMTGTDQQTKKIGATGFLFPTRAWFAPPKHRNFLAVYRLMATAATERRMISSARHQKAYWRPTRAKDAVDRICADRIIRDTDPHRLRGSSPKSTANLLSAKAYGAEGAMDHHRAARLTLHP